MRVTLKSTWSMDRPKTFGSVILVPSTFTLVGRINSDIEVMNHAHRSNVRTSGGPFGRRCFGGKNVCSGPQQVNFVWTNSRCFCWRKFSCTGPITLGQISRECGICLVLRSFLVPIRLLVKSTSSGGCLYCYSVGSLDFNFLEYLHISF